MSEVQRGQAPAGVELIRWTVTSGSSVQSRCAVVVAAGGRHWDATAEGNGPIDALYRAVDRALRDILGGEPRLLAYDIHALAEGPDAEGEVQVTVGPPAGAEGDRAAGSFVASARSTNIIAASITAYIDALGQMLSQASWADAAAAAAGRHPAGTTSTARAEHDEEESETDVIGWFER
jgi:2-isopropylmalate synthase